jgi:RepB DNA-primase from phage plasmid
MTTAAVHTAAHETGDHADVEPASANAARDDTERRTCPPVLDCAEADKLLIPLNGGRDGGKFTFQTFDDNAQRKNRTLSRIFHGTLMQHASALAALGQQGAGLYVTVNQTDLRGRRTENVVAVRALFVDLDGAPIDPVRACEKPPNVVVESSRGKFHAYWLNDGTVPLDRFTELQLKLAVLFDGDKKVSDPTRVLRLPGSWHQKVGRDGARSEPFMTRVIKGEVHGGW